MIRDLFATSRLFAPEQGGASGADHEKSDDTKQADDTKQDDTKQDDTGKTFTRDELASIVSAQLEDFKSNKLPDMLEKAKEDGKAEANMSAKELAEKQAKEHEAQLEAREQALNAKEAKLATSSLLNEKKMPEALQKVLLEPLAGMKSDERAEAVDSIVKALGEAVQAEIVNRAKGTSTPATGGKSDTQISKEQWNKMSYSEQAKVYQENPTLAQSLMS
jgi:hypothetical protein